MSAFLMETLSSRASFHSHDTGIITRQQRQPERRRRAQVCSRVAAAAWGPHSTSTSLTEMRIPGKAAETRWVSRSEVAAGAKKSRSGKEPRSKKTDPQEAPAAQKEGAAVAVAGEPEEGESWLAEGVEDAKAVVSAAADLVPGPRVGSSSLPWALAVPLAYLGLTFVLAVVKTVRKMNSPRTKRRRQVGKNAELVESLDQLLESPETAATFGPKEFKLQERKFGFGAAELVRKYLRYALNEKPFSPDLVSSLIRLRHASGLRDEEVAEVLNDVSRRTVKAKGPVVMDMSGFTEKGLQRKVAVQALFTKLLYLSELEDFCSQAVREKLEMKAIFGVTDEDADSIRIASLSSAEDLEKLDKAMQADTDDMESQDSEE